MKRRMKDIVLLFAASFLVVAVSPVAASTRSLRRAQPVNSQRTDAEKKGQRDLEGSQDEYNQYYEEYDNPKYGNNRYENGWLNGANADDAAYAGNADANSTIFYQVEQQVEEDLNHMWKEAPSEWNEEMWEIFGSIILLSVVIFVCCFLICCTPCCSPDSVSKRTVQTEGYVDGDGDYDPNADVAGGSPIQNGAPDKETSLLEGGQPDGSRAAAAATAGDHDIVNVPSNSRRSSNRDSLRRSSSRSRSRTARGRGGVEPSSRSGGIRKFKRKRRTLWQETVDVWGEFLTETFGTAEERRRQRYKRRDEARDSYKRFEDDPQPTRVASAGTVTSASDVEHQQGQAGSVAYNTTATSTSVGATTDEDESKVARGTMA